MKKAELSIYDTELTMYDAEVEIMAATYMYPLMNSAMRIVEMNPTECNYVKAATFYAPIKYKYVDSYYQTTHAGNSFVCKCCERRKHRGNFKKEDVRADGVAYVRVYANCLDCQKRYKDLGHMKHAIVTFKHTLATFDLIDKIFSRFSKPKKKNK